MSTVLIDRSLVGMKFDDSFSQDKKMMFVYACSLLEAGATYIEVDFDSVVRLPKPSGAENYIFRLNRPEEYVVANALSFSYAVVPLKYFYVQPKLEIPAILEIDTEDSDVFAVLQVISSEIDLSLFSMLRLVGEFEPNSVRSLVSTYNKRTIIPLDLCPKNAKLNALASAIAAVKARSSAVTVKFGDFKDFASLEELLIILASMHGITVSSTYLEGICKASMFLSMITDTDERSNLSLMMQKYMHGPLRIENIDTPPNREEAELRRLLGSRVRVKNPAPRRHFAARSLDSLGVEREISDEIIKILQKCAVEISKFSVKPK